MTLQDHLDVLGWTPQHCSFRTGLPEAVIARALRGDAIAGPHAQRLVEVLSKEHGISHGYGSQPLTVQDIDGLRVLSPDDLRKSRPTPRQGGRA